VYIHKARDIIGSVRVNFSMSTILGLLGLIDTYSSVLRGRMRKIHAFYSMQRPTNQISSVH
jgi:hypothetical protein